MGPGTTQPATAQSKRRRVVGAARRQTLSALARIARTRASRASSGARLVEPPPSDGKSAQHGVESTCARADGGAALAKRAAGRRRLLTRRSSAPSAIDALRRCVEEEQDDEGLGRRGRGLGSAPSAGVDAIKRRSAERATRRRLRHARPGRRRRSSAALGRARRAEEPFERAIEAVDGEAVSLARAARRAVRTTDGAPVVRARRCSRERRARGRPRPAKEERNRRRRTTPTRRRRRPSTPARRAATAAPLRRAHADRGADVERRVSSAVSACVKPRSSKSSVAERPSAPRCGEPNAPCSADAKCALPRRPPRSRTHFARARARHAPPPHARLAAAPRTVAGRRRHTRARRRVERGPVRRRAADRAGGDRGRERGRRACEPATRRTG